MFREQVIWEKSYCMSVMISCGPAILDGKGSVRYWRKTTSGLICEMISWSIRRCASSDNKIRSRKQKLLDFLNLYLFRLDRGRVSLWISLDISQRCATLNPSWLLSIGSRSMPLSSLLPNNVMSSWQCSCSLSMSWSYGEFWWALWTTWMVDSLILFGPSYLPSWGWVWIYPQASTLRLIARPNDSIVCSRITYSANSLMQDKRIGTIY